MTTSERDLQRMLQQAHTLPRGAARFAALDAVFRHADAAGNTEFGFNARMSAMSDFHHGGDPARLFLAFSWCLAHLDRHPESVGHHERSLLWNFKWVVWSLPQFPDIPLERTMAVLDDMERRYRLGGHSLHAVYQHRWLVAHHVGDLTAAEQWYDRMLTAPRDSLSDCHACVPSGQVRHLVSLGRYEEAITVGAPFKNGGCTEQPQWMLAELLPPMLHTGRYDDAVEAFRNGYARARGDRHHLDNLGQYLLFCGLTGNEVRGLDIIERHLGWLERPSSPYAAMEFASAAAQVLGRLQATGQGDRTVRRRSEDGARRWESRVDELADELATHARELAARFDARNGNNHQGGRVEARISAPPLVGQLPLTVLAGRRPDDRREKGRATVDALLGRLAEQAAAGDVGGAARTQLAVARALRDAGQWRDAAEAAEEALRALDRAGLSEEVLSCRYLLFQLYSTRRYLHREDAATQVTALLAAERLPTEAPSSEVLLEQAADAVEGPQAVGWLLAAADRYRARAAGSAPATPAAVPAGTLSAVPAGTPAAAVGASETPSTAAGVSVPPAGVDDPGAGEFRTLRKALIMLVRQPSVEPDLAVLDRIDALRGSLPDVPLAELVTVHEIAAQLLARVDRFDDAIARLDQALALIEDDGPGVDEVEDLRAARGRLLLRANRPADAEAEARALLELEPDSWEGGIVLARALRAQGRDSEATEVMAEHGIDDEDLDWDEADDD
ncbi:hypothetical protein [Plantactinospora sonchi]|uniref:Tetratricopeptide repeat protein n=1 Tax=Plantactinospora sonchi TaxID=1544735 RepID=A0ABU7RSF3_9ACTN